MLRRCVVVLSVLLACLSAGEREAAADMAVNPGIVDFAVSGGRRRDVDVENRGRDRLYVVVEPARIVNPGGPNERRMRDPDPNQLGLIATPARLILEPGEKKLVRISLLHEPGDTDRIFRVTIKPVVGKLQATRTAVKVVVAYDLLVIQRPRAARDGLTANRNGQILSIRNQGNTNALLFDGKQCNDTGANCVTLPVKRIYPGGEWRLRLPRPGPVSYVVQTADQSARKSF